MKTNFQTQLSNTPPQVCRKIFNNAFAIRLLSSIADHFNSLDDAWDGYQCYMKFFLHGSPSDSLIYHFFSDLDHGTYAKTKLETLKKLPNLHHTGATSIQTLRDQLLTVCTERAPLYHALSNLDHPYQIPTGIHEELKEKGLALMYGAVSVPIICYGLNRILYFDIQVSVSGGSQEQDLLTAFQIFREAQHALHDLHAEYWFEYDLSPFREDQRCHYCIKLLNLQEIIPKQ